MTASGLRRHCLHRPGKARDAIPLMLLHGWPGSFVQMLHFVEGLACPAPRGDADEHARPAPPAPRAWGEGFCRIERRNEIDIGGHVLEREERERVAGNLRAFLAGRG